MCEGGHYFWLGASADADRAGGLRPEPVAQSQPKALIPCAICRADLANPFGSSNQPLGATEFVTPGHYGSTMFDPMDGSALAINLCDECLFELRRDRVVGLYRGGGFKKWGRK